ncbi:heavy-metal-associated domain-containing protein [Halobium palmae]|uniref:Heavy-metal-associated domain-containing protein n=1 Tax=Halobium palmae TaxID=1776492 RepID=A0ABD5S0W8_9EURY
MESYTLHVDGMSCTGCEAAITSELQSLGHVTGVEADRRTGTVEFKTADTDGISAVGSAIEELGYEVIVRT